MIISINEFVASLNEAKSKKDVLIIVDVQKSFARFFPTETYVEDIMDYAKKFSVIQIWDSINNERPDYHFQNTIVEISKKYGDQLEEDCLDLFLPYQQEEIKDKLDKNSFQQYDNYIDKHGDTWIYVNNEHEWFLCPSEMITHLSTLISKNITLIGGAGSKDGNHNSGGECLYDIQVVLELLKLPYELNDNFIYHA